MENARESTGCTTARRPNHWVSLRFIPRALQELCTTGTRQDLYESLSVRRRTNPPNCTWGLPPDPSSRGTRTIDRALRRGFLRSLECDGRQGLGNEFTQAPGGESRVAGTVCSVEDVGCSHPGVHWNTSVVSHAVSVVSDVFTFGHVVHRRPRMPGEMEVVELGQPQCVRRRLHVHVSGLDKSV